MTPAEKEALKVVTAYYQARGKKPDILATPILMEFVRWMQEQHGGAV
jgi:hypothetical protein